MSAKTPASALRRHPCYSHSSTALEQKVIVARSTLLRRGNRIKGTTKGANRVLVPVVLRDGDVYCALFLLQDDDQATTAKR